MFKFKIGDTVKLDVDCGNKIGKIIDLKVRRSHELVNWYLISYGNSNKSVDTWVDEELILKVLNKKSTTKKRVYN